MCYLSLHSEQAGGHTLEQSHINIPPALPFIDVSEKFTGRVLARFLETQTAEDSPSKIVRVSGGSICIITTAKKVETVI